MKKELNRLNQIEKELYLLHGAAALLRWDQSTIMPKNAIEQRGDQNAYLSKIAHEKVTSPELRRIVNKLSRKGNYRKLSKLNKIRIKELKKDIDKANKIPASFVEKESRLITAAGAAWEKAREKNDFKIFEPYLRKIVGMQIEYAKLINKKEHPYNVLFDDYEEGMKMEDIDKVFSKLKPELITLINKIKKSEKYKKQKNILSKLQFPPEIQKKLVKDITKRIGLDGDRALIGESVHPFTIGISNDDVRITTAYRLGKPMFSFGSTIHEAGHALYYLGYPEKLKNTILFGASSYGMHESQSRFWELQIVARKEFWDFYYKTFKNSYKSLKNISKEKFYELINQVKPSFVRIEADELTYSLHIVIRYELEKALMEGKLKVKDLPKAWNKKYEEYLGVKPRNDKEGVLQDVHWSHGSIGYFPTYVLGTIYAAMLFNQMQKEDKNLKKNIQKGNFKPILGWLRKNIHSKGATMMTKDIIKKCCKKDLDPDDFVTYLKGKYSKIYKLQL